MIDLQECRNEIDKIDSDIIRLFEQRMKVCEDVAEYKIRTGKKVLDPERERQKLEVLRGKAHGEFNQLGAQELFQQITADDEHYPNGFFPSDHYAVFVNASL